MRVLHRCVYGKAVVPFGKMHVTSVGHVCGRQLPQSMQAFSKGYMRRSLCVYVSSSGLGSERRGPVVGSGLSRVGGVGTGRVWVS